MTYAERVRRAGGISEAMIVLAEGIDEILTREPTDSWGKWAPAEPAAPQPDNSATIARVEKALAEATDPEDILALQARLRLLRDDGRPAEPAVPEGERIRVTTGDQTIDVDLPLPDPERMKSRLKWAAERQLAKNFLSHLGEDEVLRAFAKGGPMWLYLGNRDAVLAMPVDWRRELVTDIERDSPAQAQEVARDILKHGHEEAMHADVAIENLVGQGA